MEKVENTVNELTNRNFIKHVFNFDKKTQMNLLNIVQYLVRQLYLSVFIIDLLTMLFQNQMKQKEV